MGGGLEVEALPEGHRTTEKEKERERESGIMRLAVGKGKDINRALLVGPLDRQIHFFLHSVMDDNDFDRVLSQHILHVLGKGV